MCWEASLELSASVSAFFESNVSHDWIRSSLNCCLVFFCAKLPEKNLPDDLFEVNGPELNFLLCVLEFEKAGAGRLFVMPKSELCSSEGYKSKIVLK